MQVLRSTLRWSPADSFALTIFVDGLRKQTDTWRPVNRGRRLYVFRASDGRGWSLMEGGRRMVMHTAGWAGEHTVVAAGLGEESEGTRLFLWRFVIEDDGLLMEGHAGPVLSEAQKREIDERWLPWLQTNYQGVAWAGQ